MFGNFGGTSGFGSFGQNKPATSTFASAGTNLFGNPTSTGGFSTTASTNVFGQPQASGTTNIFGGFNQPKPATGIFGTSQPTTMFGQPNRLPGTGTGGIFSTGATSTVSPFSATGQTQQTGTSIPFNPITGNDTMMRNGVASAISTRNQCITCMKEYENKSLEELRLEDYQLGRKGPSQTNVFGGGQQQTAGGMFPLGQNTGTTTTFGQQTAAFGAAANQTSSLFPSINQQKPQTSFFPNTGAATSAFGGTTFPFNTPTSQPSLFPTNSVTTSGVGSFQFPSSSQPQQSSLGIFGSKTTTAAFGANTFNTATNTTINKPVPLFGGTATSFGTTTNTAFGQQPSLFPTTSQPQNKPAFSFGPTFGTQPTSQSTFGTSAFPTWSNTTSNASLNLGSSGFGTTGTSGFPSFGTTTTNFQSPITNTGFGAGTFNLGNTTTNTSGLSLFNPSGTLGAAPPNFNTISGPAPFGTTPYKDSPLFYNLVTNRSVEDMTKPTNPVAQRQIREASRRKTSSLNSKSVVTGFTFPVPKIHSKKESFFDGFEEEDQGTAIDILSPKTSVKKLAIKNLRGGFHRSSLSTSSFNGSVVEEPSVTEDGGTKANDSQVLNSSNNGLNASVSELFIHRAQPKESGDLNESSCSESPSDSYYVAVNNQNGNGNETYNESYHDKSNAETAHDQYSGYDGAQNHPCGVKYTRSGYYISPDIKELDLLTDAQENCFVRGFIVGRHNYGEIRFLDVVNVGNLDIDETVLFRHKEVVVYPDDNNKPPVGEGINVPAEIRLERVWPIDKATKDPIKVPAKVKALKYEEKLKKSCERLGAEFISYDEQTGRWVFKVSHFSKYSCAPEEEEEDDVSSAAEIPKSGGLGGKTVQNLKTFVGPTQALIIEEDSEGRNLEAPKAFRPEPTSLAQESESGFPERVYIGGGGEPCIPEGALELAGPKNGAPDFAIMSGAIAGGDNVMDMFGSMEEKVDDFPDYFGLSTDVLKSAVPEVSPTVLTNLQSAKVPQHRKRDEIPFLDAVRKQTKFLALHRFPQSNSRKGARVAFGPSGNYIRVVNKSKDYPRANRFIGQVKVEKLTPYREVVNRGESAYPQFYANILTKQLVLMMEHSSPNNLYKLRPEGIVGELIKTLLDDEELQKWQDDQFVSSVVAEPNYIATCKEELQLWLLCNILWPCEELSEDERQDKGFLIEYRIRLADWFKSNAKMLFGSLYDPADTTLKGLLKKGMHLEACELAVEQGNFNLALNLAQCCGESQKAMQLQMDEWEAQGMVEFIPKDVLELYRLCSGLPIWDDIDIKHMSTCEWLQHFAIYLWYICPMNFSIEEAVIHYQTSVVEYAQCDFDVEYPSRLDSSIANTCIHLLKSYVTVGYKIPNLLNPRTNNPDCLDYKLSWLLMHNLKQLGYHPDPDLVEDLTVGFAGQLETMGLFHWAIYVLKTLPQTTARDVMIDRILERNVTTGMRIGQEKSIEFIETLLEIPRTHIEEHCFRV
ncbi:unnamed protein product [Allacma fusca]|uniref:Nuclear pore complex protein Nup98-Nup96 n=1 Tax=Allacma fusca TaxID=39272 RepID=A0A8J2JHG5_9HEXA|nr:unnamed protein product [Allacma fusca]